MQPIDAIAVVGEVVSWIGLGIGIPMLVIAGMIALAEGHWERVDIAVIERSGAVVLRWFAGGDFRERPLGRREQADEGWHHGFVSARDPSHVRLKAPVLRRVLTTLGTVFAGLGVVGLILSFVPAFV